MPSTDIAQRTPAQQLVARVREPLTRDQLQAALPPTVTVDRFVRVMSTAILTNPEIAKLDHQSVLTAMVQSAAMGLIPDGKQAAITPRGGKAALVPMIQGYRDIAAEHGWTLRTAVVYANDEFDHVVEDAEEKILHRPVRPGAERGELIASYAIAKHRDGRKLMTVLHPDDIAHRRRSSSYAKVWDEHPAAMWEKSAGRDIFGQLGLAESDAHAQKLLAAELDPEEAAAAMYGSRRVAASAETSTTGLPAAEQGDVRQQADGPVDQTPAGSSVPGDDEPDLDAQSELNADEQAAIEAAANQAALFALPNGKHQGKTLGEIAQVEGGDSWFLYALRKDDLNRTVAAATWNFCRVYKPELYTQVLAEKEAQAA